MVPMFRADLAVAGFIGTIQGAVMVTVTGGLDTPVDRLLADLRARGVSIAAHRSDWKALSESARFGES